MADVALTTSSSAPWAAQQPYLTNLFQRADQLYNKGPLQYYGGNQIAPFSADTRSAFDMVRNQAANNQFQNQAQNLWGNLANASGTGVPDYATHALQQTASGQMLNANPYLNQMFDQASSRVADNFRNTVMPGINSAAEGAGRYGSGMQALISGQAQQNLGDTLNRLATDIYGGNYAQERVNQMNAASNAAQFGNQSYGQNVQAQLGALQGSNAMNQMQYTPAQMMLNIGNAQEAQAQRNIDADMQRFAYQQEAPYDQLSRYGSLIQGAYGSQGSGTQPIYSGSNTAQNIGAGLGLFGLANSIFNWF